MPSSNFEYYDDNDNLGGEKIFFGNVTEYETFKSTNSHNAACAVCMIEGRGLTMIMPTNHTCPESWTEEYKGYLMTGNTCVDKELKAIDTTRGYNGGPVLRHQIGSKTLNPNSDENKVLSCVVCSI